MSHDIGALRGLHSTYRDLLQQAVSANNAFDAAIAASLVVEFGPAPVGSVADWRAYTVSNARLHVRFDASPGMWSAVAQIAGGHPCIRKLADTPRAAVTQALAALAVTHPTEAAALAAVIPPEKP
jgi:hypothetical protein